MTEDRINGVKGDRALSEGESDRLGFRGVAQQIAMALVDNASEDGLVVGVEGAWGSGKSSLLFLIVEEFNKLPKERRPTTIDFRPWIIGNRHKLISSLFGEISGQLEYMVFERGNTTSAQMVKAKAAAQAFREFMVRLSPTGTLFEVVGSASGFAPLVWIGKILKSLKKKKGSPQLSELKDKLSKILKDLDHRFIITIDDVDRLEPAEILEILRLVRSVVDLPNITYLLCYDREILAQGIERAAGVRNGKDFLEKIVQLTVMVPKPEPLQLRQWFTDELQAIATVKNDDELSRLKLIIDHEGGQQLRTPRSVVRTLDAIRFFWPPLRELGGDLADLVWLQLIKDGNPKLYRWIEDYSATVAVTSLRIATVDASEQAAMHAELLATVPEEHFDNVMYRHNFADQLPGVEIRHSAEENGIIIFRTISDYQRDKAILGRRLASPHHYRLYFALADPSHALTHADVTAVWAGANCGSNQAGRALLNLHQENLSGSLTKADLLLDRIKGNASQILSALQSENILVAFSQILDEAYRLRPFDSFKIDSIWQRAGDAMPSLLSKIDTKNRNDVIAKMFNEGVAIGWLTHILRREIFNHGLYGGNAIQEENWLLNTEEVKHAIETMVIRYRLMTFDEIFNCPQPISLLFAWRQAGDPDGPRKLISENIVSDGDFLRTMEFLTGTIYSSDRITYAVLTARDIDSFLDFEQTVQRIHDLRDNDELGERAISLAKAIKDGEYFQM